MRGLSFALRPRAGLRMAGTLFTAILALSLAAPASASTRVITVTTTASGTSVDGFCSLDEAVGNANADTAFSATAGECPAGRGKDTINFNIFGAGPHVIHTSAVNPQMLLITRPLILDGTSQPGYTDAYVPQIVLDNDNGTASVVQLMAGSSGSTIKGLALADSQGSGIGMDHSNSNIILGNYFNVDGNNNDAALAGVGLDSGVFILNSSSNKIGGPSNIPGNSNYFGHLNTGVNISFGSKNLVKGNFIGASKTHHMANQQGVLILDGVSNVVGGTGVYDGNLISDSGGFGVNLSGAVKTTIQRNVIGLQDDGLNSAGNLVGINVDAASTGTLIGGAKAGNGNVISNNGTGVYVLSTATTTVEHNTFGLTTVGGHNAMGNSFGIWADNAGSVAAIDNIIADSIVNGVESDATSTFTTASVGNCFTGNAVGVDLTGSGTINLPKNWWDDPTGPNSPGSGQPIVIEAGATGFVNAPSPLTAAPAYCIAPDTPVLSQPIATGVFFATQPALSWKPVKGIYGYELQISPDNYASITTDVILNKTSYSVRSVRGVPAPFGFWYWRVRAIGPNWIGSSFPTTASYQVTLHKSPLNAATLTSRTVKLVWNKEPNSTSYSLTWDTFPPTSQMLITGITTTTYTLTVPAAGDYEWSIHPDGALTNPSVSIAGMGFWIFTTP